MENQHGNWLKYDFIKKGAIIELERKSEELLWLTAMLTNSHSQLVKSQLESTDATLVEVYSAEAQM